MEKKQIVVIGGGGGASMVLSGLRDAPSHIAVSSIVPMADNGGSTGRLMVDYHVPPVGDITLHLLATARNETMRDLLAVRFGYGCLKGHTVRNILLTAKAMNSPTEYEAGIALIAHILDARSSPIPSTLEHINLRVTYGKHQKELIGEHEIEVAPPLEEPRIFSLVPGNAEANPKAIEAIAKADLIVLAPGSIFGSILPVLLLKDLAAALQKTSAKIVMIINLVNNTQEDTIGWTAERFIQEIETHLGGRKIDHIIAHNQPINETVLAAGLPGTEHIQLTDLSDEHQAKLIADDFLREELATTQAGDFFLRNPLKHDAKKIAAVLLQLL